MAQEMARIPTVMPYIPGLLSFRELPALLAALALLPRTPDLVFVDGHGISHPRRLGVAAHLGVVTDLPSIGVAKSKLVGRFVEPGAEAGAHTPLLDGDEQLGWCCAAGALRSRCSWPVAIGSAPTPRWAGCSTPCVAIGFRANPAGGSAGLAAGRMTAPGIPGAAFIFIQRCTWPRWPCASSPWSWPSWLVSAALGRRRLATGFATMVRFNLQCDVLDTEVIMQATAQLAAQRIGVGAVAHHNVRGQRRRAGSQRPHVQVMHVQDCGVAGQAVAHPGHPCPWARLPAAR